ncbi:hypothetical protein BT63DRAFT_453924 [Microthyrium microscopicum]|uniref:Uncharacterized protein n=1 Tax=Microthyrium microscopicum TaxID=703497 RepID=A0A6A6UKD4_9PEZI|nr:hypothetical protein BT63DRAFT_453924 [Microthyrium microscopicum]
MMGWFRSSSSNSTKKDADATTRQNALLEQLGIPERNAKRAPLPVSNVEEDMPWFPKNDTHGRHVSTRRSDVHVEGKRHLWNLTPHATPTENRPLAPGARIERIGTSSQTTGEYVEAAYETLKGVYVKNECDSNSAVLRNRTMDQPYKAPLPKTYDAWKKTTASTARHASTGNPVGNAIEDLRSLGRVKDLSPGPPRFFRIDGKLHCTWDED